MEGGGRDAIPLDLNLPETGAAQNSGVVAFKAICLHGPFRIGSCDSMSFYFS